MVEGSGNFDETPGIGKFLSLCGHDGLKGSWNRGEVETLHDPLSSPTKFNKTKSVISWVVH